MWVAGRMAERKPTRLLSRRGPLQTGYHCRLSWELFRPDRPTLRTEQDTACDDVIMRDKFINNGHHEFAGEERHGHSGEK